MIFEGYLNKQYKEYVMKKLLFIFLFSIGSSYVMAQNEVAVDPQAKKILDASYSAVANYTNGFKADFSLTIENEKTEKNTVMNGLILMKGEKFKLQLPDMETYYNGKVEYVYMIKEKEVNVSEPKKDDLQEINPLMLLNSYKKNYKMKLIGTSEKNGKTFDVVNLYPNDRSKPYSIVTIMIDTNSKLPYFIKTKGKNGINMMVEISNHKKENLQDESFVFNEKNHPGVEVIDLR